MCKSGRFTQISPVWANKCAKAPVSHIFPAAAVSGRSSREQKRPFLHTKPAIYPFREQKEPFSLTKQSKRLGPREMGRPMTGNTWSWRGISRTQGCKNGLLRIAAQHMPHRKVGYVAFGHVQWRFCYQNLGRHREYNTLSPRGRNCGKTAFQCILTADVSTISRI